MKKVLAYALAVAVTVAGVSYAVFAQPARSRLDVVKARGRVICGISGSTVGFSFVEPRTGEMVGFDADFCRALAAFINVPSVEFVQHTSASRIPAVIAGSVDVVFRTTTVTYSRDAQVDFGPITFYDGQRLLVRTASKVRGLDDLNNAKVCTQTGTTSERNITDQMRFRNYKFELITFAQPKEAFDGFVAGRCDVWTTDASQLTAFRATAPRPIDYMVVGKEFSDEPLGPIYQENDSKWADAVDYTVWGLIQAEELGITQITAGSEGRLKELGDKDPVTKALVAAGDGAVVRMVRAIGNYGEIYSRYFGPARATAIPRQGTRNALSRNGGAMTSRPFR